jgi:hypothetical protein
MVIGNGGITENEPTFEAGEKWLPDAEPVGFVRFRKPIAKSSTSSVGTLEDLRHRYQRSLERIADDGRNHVPTLSA